MDCDGAPSSTSPVPACAVLADGAVRCWGAHAGHGLGGVGDVNTPAAVPGIADATKVVAGEGHTCVLHEGGTVSCWGRSGFGESGTEAARVWPPAEVAGLTGVTALVAGSHHSCALVAGGAVFCWGRGDWGNIGDGASRLRNATPQAADGLVSISLLAAGRQHTCGAAAGGLLCWGRDDLGQVGVRDRDWHAVPERALPTGARAFGLGANHGCICVAMASLPPSAQGLHCWGNNSYGQLGVPPSADALGPQRIDPRCSQVLAGGEAFCEIETAPGTVNWGANHFGQLGDGTRSPPHRRPRAPPSVQLAASGEHAYRPRTERCAAGAGTSRSNGSGTWARLRRSVSPSDCERRR